MKIEHTFLGQNGTITSITVSSKYIITGSDDGSIFIWDYNGVKLNSFNSNTGVKIVRTNEKGNQLAFINNDNELHLFTLPNLKSVWNYTLTCDHSIIEWSPSGEFIGALNGGGIHNSISVLNVSTGIEEYSLYGAPKIAQLSGFSWSNDSKYISTISIFEYPYSKNIDIWELETKRIINRIPYLLESFSITWIPNTEFIASANGNEIYIYWMNFSEYQKLSYPYEQFQLISSNPYTNDFLAISTLSETCFIWTWNSNEKIDRPNVLIKKPIAYENASNYLEINGIAWGSRNIQEVLFRLDSGDWYRARGTNTWQSELDISYFEVGSHNLFAISYDGKYYSDPAIVPFTIITNSSDYQITMYFDQPKEHQIFTTSENLKISGIYQNFKYPDPQQIQLALDNATWFDITPDTYWEYYLNISQIKNGNHIIYSHGYDGKKWSNIISVMINIQNPVSPPIGSSIFVDFPIDGSIINNTIEIRGHTENLLGNITVRVETEYDGNWQQAIGNISWNYTLNTTKIPDGPLQIFAYAENGNNFTNTDIKTYIVKNNNTIANKAPTIKIISPTNYAKLNQLTEISGIASDDKEVISVFVKVDNGSWEEAIGKNNWKIHINPKSTGNHIIQSKSYDGQLFSTTDTITITIKPSKPPNKHNYDIYYSTYITNGIIFILLFIISIIIVFIIRYNIKKEQKNIRNISKKEKIKQKYKKIKEH
jgi:hypothetical protein